MAASAIRPPAHQAGPGTRRLRSCASNTVMIGINDITSPAWPAVVHPTPTLSNAGQIANDVAPESTIRAMCRFSLGGVSRAAVTKTSATPPASADRSRPTVNPSTCATAILLNEVVALQSTRASRAVPTATRSGERRGTGAAGSDGELRESVRSATGSG